MKTIFHPPRWLVATAALLLWGGVATAADLSVCIDKTSPTARMDAALAQAVAKQQGAALRVHAFDGSGDDDGFDMKEFHKLAQGQCALVLGFPMDADARELPGDMRATAPYAHTGFVLVTPAGSKADALDRLPAGSSVAVTYLTTPNLYFAAHPNLRADVHRDDADAIKALAAHQDQAAMLWQPTVARYLAGRGGRARFQYHPLAEPHARFNLVALYAADQAGVAKAFEQSVAALRADGQLQKLLQPYAEAGQADEAAEPRAATWWRGAAEQRAGRTCGGAASAKPSAAKTSAKAAAGALPALYTGAQADSGKQKFLANCAQCHGPTLEGRAGPALKGPNFASAKANFKVGDVFAIVSQNMPATQPGSLPHDDYVEIMAFLLQQNGYPSGDAALTFDEALKSKVALRYHGP